MDSLIEIYKTHIPALPNWLQCISDGVWTDTRKRHHVRKLTPNEVDAIGEKYRNEVLAQWQQEWQEEQAQLAQRFSGRTRQYFPQPQPQAVTPLRKCSLPIDQSGISLILDKPSNFLPTAISTSRRTKLKSLSLVSSFILK
jgi:hypothetical protein